LVAYFVTLLGNEGYKLTGDLCALAERTERDVAGKEQSGWFIRDAGIIFTPGDRDLFPLYK